MDLELRPSQGLQGIECPYNAPHHEQYRRLSIILSHIQKYPCIHALMHLRFQLSIVSFLNPSIHLFNRSFLHPCIHASMRINSVLSSTFSHVHDREVNPFYDLGRFCHVKVIPETKVIAFFMMA